MPDPTDLPGALSTSFVEGLYEQFLHDPASVPADWRAYFERLSTDDAFTHRKRLGPSFPRASLFHASGSNGAATHHDRRASDLAALQDKVDQLVRGFRVRGHQTAQLDPLGTPRPAVPDLDPAFYGFAESDLDRSFSTSSISGQEVHTLREIVARLRNTYCRSIGVQFMHIDEPLVRKWLQERMESSENRLALTRDEQLRILTRLTDAVIFEEFIQKKFLGAKSFSLEGAESLIPLLDLAIEKAGEHQIDEIVLAMAHRGRLNVLANIMGKNPREIFREFEDKDAELNLGRGDVKYHLGFSADWKAANGKSIHLSLCFNPSHLEYVNTVALGRMRAKQDREADFERTRGMVLLVHGDAAFAGEGILQETLNLSQLEGYRVGGTVHVVVNNQIGFTTGADQGRSCAYATDVAKMLQIPIFHVNGEDPEAVAQVVRLAMDFRKTFQRDVVVDMYGYRRRGHNEGDEPSFTQPLLYRAIEKRKPLREGYLEHLLTLGGVTRAEADEIAVKRREHLEGELSAARSKEYQRPVESLGGVWTNYHGGADKQAKELDTGVERARLAELLEIQTRLPADFHPHPKVERILEVRRQMARGEKPLDWAAGESLAFATLATEWIRVRMSGQDAERGTFSHRHSVLHDFEDGHTYMPLEHLAESQAPVEIINSPLSEAGVMGFEYGYSLDCPEGLVLWEAQFGDFWNCAQVIVDQFLASAEEKWRRLSGIVLLLPHGMEGQGPEHSSARLERFLALAAEDNIVVANPTTPAQYFHLLRRQVLGPRRKPLIVMSPKSLLRHARAVSSLDELARGRFKRILPDALAARTKPVARVLLCSGKLYFDLVEEREKRGRDDVAILRVEQLYPMADESLRAAMEPFAADTPAVWVQEEAENMGAWRYLRARFGERLLGNHPFSGVSRRASSSPATGSGSSHRLEQAQIVERAFAG